MKQQEERLNQIQALKGIAFLGVALSHTGLVCFYSSGHWGVSLFLTLSGFMMTYKYLFANRIPCISFVNLLKFVWNKMKKLYPLHVVTMLAMLIFEFIGGAKLIMAYTE